MGSDGLVSLSVEQGAEAVAYTALLEERLSLAMLYEAWHATPKPLRQPRPNPQAP